MNTELLNRRLRISGIMIFLGLTMELVSLVWLHPLAFFVFCGGGDVVLVLGILYYFWALLNYATGHPATAPAKTGD
ncbi:MAG: hypothetical protein K1Y36_19855 [Blastocatellia bacterium]|nr:hypothetical protein [Blastocatellia bacterium]